MAIDGLVTQSSKYNFTETLAALEREIGTRGMTVFAKIDHGAGAQLAGLTLRPTVLLLFGNAKAGTPLMQQAQTVGIDLPLKLLVWENEKGGVQISYNQPAWIAARHGVENAQIIAAMTMGLAATVQQN
jgi:uncharacterized protein (DUF302 family)